MNMTTNSGVSGSADQYAFDAELVDVRPQVPGVRGEPRLPHRVVRRRPPPPGRRRATPWSRRRRSCRRPAGPPCPAAARPRRPPARRSRTCAAMPASSTTRRSWSSPQRPRASGRRSAVTSAWVCSRSCSAPRRVNSTCWASSACDRVRAMSDSRSCCSTRASVSRMGADERLDVEPLRELPVGERGPLRRGALEQRGPCPAPRGPALPRSPPRWRSGYGPAGSR